MNVVRGTVAKMAPPDFIFFTSLTRATINFLYLTTPLNAMLIILTLVTTCLDGFVISQGGVGSTAFTQNTKHILRINDIGDADGIKHAFPSFFEFDNGLRSKTACAPRALVIIGDPFHSIKSVVRRFKMLHINKLRARAHRPAMTLAAFTELSTARQLQASAIIEFMHAWLEVNYTYVKVVTTTDLFKHKDLWQLWLKTGQDANLY